MVQVLADKATLTPFSTYNGVKFHPLWQLVPFLEPTYTDYEKNFDAAPGYWFLYNNRWIPLVSSILYIAFSFLGPKFMKDRKPLPVKKYLAGWNLALSIVSFIGALRVGSHLLYLLSPWGGYTFRDTICRNPEESYADNATGLWCLVFTTSKLFELFDTFFVVARKRPLIFLHWYHHATVLLCSWFGHITYTPALYFVSINFSVHAIMYFYYFLMAINAKPKWFNPMWITVIQISQMFVGIGVNSMETYYKWFSPEGCHVDERMILAVHVMYATYLYLFVEFFVKRFIFKSPKEKGAASSTTKVNKTKSAKAL